ncbi:MAG: tRNA (adenosine(37)-N6)-threonylcarbamoyltransferase complex transferase subunit TsaD [Spirochaetota bacterium]
MALGLAFESSCDETGVALVEDGRRVIAAPLYSQLSEHRPYGGIVPEYASRAHLEKFTPLLAEILREHPLKPGDLSYVAATTRPGLVGALLVGYQTALACARHFGVPLIGVHHLEAHLAAVSLSGAAVPYPHLGLILSGGNSAIYRLHSPGEVAVLGDTLDDAAGEALDKAAQILGLGYPGGPLIERAARHYAERHNVKPGDEARLAAENPFPLILKSLPREEISFSFSGIKTALLRAANSPGKTPEFFAFHYQERIVEHIVRNLEHAIAKSPDVPVVAAGGVMANTRLRSALEELCRKKQVTLHVPELRYCTDNAAMVAAAAHLYFDRGIESKFTNISSSNSFSGATNAAADRATDSGSR